MNWLLVASGAGLGGVLRYAWGRALNEWWPQLPLGTLLVNVLGGLLMGMVLALGSRLGEEWRWFFATGFLGGLTTFSTFSAESFRLLQGEQWLSAAVLITAHVAGSIMATLLGFVLVSHWLKA